LPSIITGFKLQWYIFKPPARWDIFAPPFTFQPTGNIPGTLFKEKKMKRSTRLNVISMSIVALIILALCTPAFAGPVTIDSISINPTEPTDTTAISITTEGWIGYAFETTYTGYNYNISGTSIDMTFFFDWSPPPGGISLPVAARWDETINIGTLLPNTYEVTANAFFGETESITFVVTPEPATLMLIGLGSLALRRRKA